MHAQYSLFQQGYNLLDEIDPYMKKLAAEVSETSSPTGRRVSYSPGPSVSAGIGLVLIWTIDERLLRNASLKCLFLGWYHVTGWTFDTISGAFCLRIVQDSNLPTQLSITRVHCGRLCLCSSTESMLHHKTLTWAGHWSPSWCLSGLREADCHNFHLQSVVSLGGMRLFYRNTELVFSFLHFQLDQLVIDSAMEKREMEHKHATIQQRVSSYMCFDPPTMDR